MIEFACSKCGAELEASNHQAGAKVSCPDCGSKMTVPQPKSARKEPGVTASKPQAKAPPPKAAPPKKTAPAAPPPKRRPRDEEEDYDEEPAPKKGSKAPLIIGVAVGGGVLLLIVVAAVAYFAFRSPSDSQAQANNENRPTTGSVFDPRQPPVVNNTTPPVVNPVPTPTTPPKQEQPITPRAGGNVGQRVYQRLLKSTVLIISVRPGAVPGTVQTGIGSGTLIDKTNRLVLTNYHVVQDGNQTAVFFPTYRDGKMIAEQEYFFRQARESKDVLIGKTVFREPKVDLALIQLDRLPPEVEALPLSSSAPFVTQPVYTVGHPGASGGLWVYTEGKVRQLLPKRKWRVAQPTFSADFESDVVLTDSATNPGDSGGPLANDRAEMVAVVHGGSVGANLLSTFIDVGEVRAALGNYSQQSSTKLALATGSDLVDLDTGDLASLIKALDDKDARVRATAVESLGNMGAKAKPAVAYLLRALKDTDPLVRRFAGQALPKLGPPDKQDLPELLNAIKDSDAQIRLYALETVGKMGADARGAIPALIEAVKDPDLTVKQAALRSLGKLGISSRDAAQKALVEALKDSDREVRQAAGEALVAVGPLPASDIPLLQELLNAKEPEARAAAALALAKMKADAKPAIKNLLAVMQDADPQVRRAVVEAVANLGPDAKQALPQLSKALLDSDKNVKRLAIDALGKIGPDAKDSVPVLADALKDVDLRVTAIKALGGIGPAAAKDAAPPLAEIINKDSNKENRMLALTTLAALKPSGTEAKVVVPTLVLLLQEKDTELRDKAVEALGKSGKAAVSDLLRALNDPGNAWVRLGAANALGEIGTDAKSAAQQLSLHAQGDADTQVRQACARALARVQH